MGELRWKNMGGMWVKRTEAMLTLLDGQMQCSQEAPQNSWETRRDKAGATFGVATAN